MSSVAFDQREFAPIVRKVTYRGKAAWEVDIRKWPEAAARIGAPLRKRFTDRDKARAYYRRLIVAEAAGATLDPVRLPVRAFFDRYQAWIEKKSPSEMTHKIYRKSWKCFEAYLTTIGVHDVADISPATMQGFLEANTGRYAPTTLATTVKVIRAAFNWGIRAGLIAANPAAGMVPHAKAPERRELTAEERHKLMNADGPCADYWRIYLLTGLRRSELISITLDRVHLDTPAPFVDVVGKGLKKRILPLEGLVLDIFARLVRVARENNTLRVCPLSSDAIGHRWDRDRTRLELPRSVRLHDLRHDFISTLANSGTPLPVVQRLAGHTQLATTAMYIHDDPAALRAAMIDRSIGVQR